VATRRVPDFFIVGHHKSGTTALYEMLRRHPQIYMPERKEPRFFDTDLQLLLAPSGAAEGRPELDEYLALFGAAGPEQRIGEASPSYLRSAVAAEAIAELAPAARIIAILREPASFVRSFHLELVQSHVESETDLATAFAREQITRHGQPVRRYSDHVRYTEQLRRYHACFPAEQVLVLIYDDFRRDNVATVRTVLRFLGVDDTHPLEPIEVNRSVRVRFVGIDRLVAALYGPGRLARATRGTVKALTPARWHGEGFRAVRGRVLRGAPRPPDEALMRQLRSHFKPEVVALSAYLGRDLVSQWDYDEIE
jgi:Sulfotransferase family